MRCSSSAVLLTLISNSFSPVGLNFSTFELAASTVHMWPAGSIRMLCGMVNIPFPHERTIPFAINDEDWVGFLTSL